MNGVTAVQAWKSDGSAHTARPDLLKAWLAKLVVMADHRLGRALNVNINLKDKSTDWFEAKKKTNLWLSVN